MTSINVEMTEFEESVSFDLDDPDFPSCIDAPAAGRGGVTFGISTGKFFFFPFITLKFALRYSLYVPLRKIS